VTKDLQCARDGVHQPKDSLSHAHAHRGLKACFDTRRGISDVRKEGAGSGKRQHTKGVRVAGHRSEGRGFIAVLRPLVT
jgi:hypothetical protein